MATVELRNIGRRYGDHVVVDDISLAIDSGELVVLVGPSGCGKSTLLRIVAGLLDPTSGTVHIDGRDVTTLPPGRRDIAMVFQSYALYPHMTVFENMAFPLRVQRRTEPEVEQRVRETAGLLGLTALLARRPRELSGGQRQRVAMGRAMVRHPKVFLFDEPLSNLDAALRTRMRAEIASLHRQLGVTTLYVTHDQHEAMTLGDRLVLLHGGRIAQQGRPLELYERPSSRFAAEFIGSPAMSFLAAEVRDGQLEVAGRRIAPAPPGAEGAVSLGIRPEHAALVPTAQGTGLVGRVSWVERAGGDAFVHVEVDGSSVVARATTDEAARIHEGEPIAILPRRLHVFSAGSGESLGVIQAP